MPSGSSANTRMTAAAAASGSPVTVPRSVSPSLAVGRGPDSGPTVATVEPAAIPVSSPAAFFSDPVRVSARVAATAEDNQGPGYSAAPSSSATTPASTIVIPAPSQLSGTSKPVTPIAASPRQTSSPPVTVIVEHGRT